MRSRRSCAKPEQARSPLERQLGALAYRQISYEHDQVPVLLKGADKTRWQELHKALKRFDAVRPIPPEPVLTVTDVGPVSPPTWIAGDRKPEPIEPGFPSVLDPAPARIEPSPAAPQSTGRRLALARWLTRPDNSALDSRDRQPGLAVSLRSRPGRHRQRFRPAGRGSHPPRAARLAGNRVCRAEAGSSSRCTA